MADEGWKISFDRAPVNVLGPPALSFDVFGHLVNGSDEPRIALVAEYTVYFMNRRIQEPAHVLLDGRPLGPGQGSSFRLTLRFSRELLDLVETNRVGQDRVELRVDAAVLGARGGGFERERVDHLQDDPYVIARDPWLEILEAFEYGKSEVYELPLRAIQLVAGYEDALLRLGEAEKALAEQNWRLVLVKLWNTFEAVGATGDGDETGFQKMVREALPREHHAEVREALMNLIVWLRLYQQRFMEAYGDEHVPVSREDALFAFEMTLSMLSYLTKRMVARSP